MGDPACKRGPASIRSYMYMKWIQDKGQKAALHQHYSTTSAISVLLRCNFDASFPILGYLNRVKISWAWAIVGGGPRPPSKYAPAWRRRHWYDNMCGRAACFQGSVTPPSQGRRRVYSTWLTQDIMGTGSQRPPNFLTSYLRGQSVRNNNQILHGDRTRCGESFSTVDHKCWRAICLR